MGVLLSGSVWPVPVSFRVLEDLASILTRETFEQACGTPPRSQLLTPLGLATQFIPMRDHRPLPISCQSHIAGEKGFSQASSGSAFIVYVA
jgi:hypothetical protein